MNVKQIFEKQLQSFPGIPSSASVDAFEKWANDVADKWNKIAPYDQLMNTTQPHYIQMLFQQLQQRQMMTVDGIEWQGFFNHLDKQPEWGNMKDIPTFLSLLIAWAHSQLTALTDAEGTLAQKRTTTAAFTHTNSQRTKRQRFRQWGAEVATAISGASTNEDPCSFCGHKHSLDQCRGLKKVIEREKERRLNLDSSSTSKPHPRAGMKSFKRPSHYGGNGAPRGSFRGRRGGFHGNKRGDRGTPRVHFNRSTSPHSRARHHTNSVSLGPEQASQQDAVRSILQANNAIPHFVGAVKTSCPHFVDVVQTFCIPCPSRKLEPVRVSCNILRAQRRTGRF
jgi:hypothetical protein